MMTICCIIIIYSVFEVYAKERVFGHLSDSFAMARKQSAYLGVHGQIKHFIHYHVGNPKSTPGRYSYKYLIFFYSSLCGVIVKKKKFFSITSDNQILRSSYKFVLDDC